MEGKLLVQLARKTVEKKVITKKKLNLPKNLPAKFLIPSGIFVTINIIQNGKKNLRGCIGYPYSVKPLAQALIDSAINAATQDPRFLPLSKHELDKVIFEISILTPPQEIRVNNPKEYPSKINVGEDGLILERGIFKGLLLPQVPIEWNWSEEDFLCQCCMKAGLPPDCWLLPGTKLFKFKAIIFEEDKPRGEVKQKTLSGA